MPRWLMPPMTISASLNKSLPSAPGVRPLVGRAGQQDKWRAGAIMIQHLPKDGGISPMQVYSGDDPSGNGEPEVDEDGARQNCCWKPWRIMNSLIPPLNVSCTELFHEDGVTVYPELKLQRYCSCLADRLKGILANMPADDRRRHLRGWGKIDVKCEFCSASYCFDLGPHLNPVRAH